MLELAEIGKISIDTIKTGLSNYKNTKDEDIELFLSQKAIDFVKRKWCSVYLLINETEFSSNHRLLIEGYFTLSIKSFRIGSTVSKNKKKRLFKGINTDCEDVPAILIGQLGKYIDETNYTVGSTNMLELLDCAMELIAQINKVVPCNLTILECRKYLDENDERIKLHNNYKDYGFVELQEDDDLIQYCIICN